ncbi:MAG: hypothetical protein AAB784_00550 [Patescibacteria group bacterium]
MQNLRDRLVTALICDVGVDPITLALRMDQFDRSGNINLVLSRDEARKLSQALIGIEGFNMRLSSPSQSGMIVVDIEKKTMPLDVAV